jgi:hypothetical protein
MSRRSSRGLPKSIRFHPAQEQNGDQAVRRNVGVARSKPAVYDRTVPFVLFAKIDDAGDRRRKPVKRDLEGDDPTAVEVPGCDCEHLSLLHRIDGVVCRDTGSRQPWSAQVENRSAVPKSFSSSCSRAPEASFNPNGTRIVPSILPSRGVKSSISKIRCLVSLLPCVCMSRHCFCPSMSRQLMVQSPSPRRLHRKLLTCRRRRSFSGRAGTSSFRGCAIANPVRVANHATVRTNRVKRDTTRPPPGFCCVHAVAGERRSSVQREAGLASNVCEGRPDKIPYNIWPLPD